MAGIELRLVWAVSLTGGPSALPGEKEIQEGDEKNFHRRAGGSCERRFGYRRTGVDADLFARDDFNIEMLEGPRDSGVDDREVFAGHANAVNGWIRQRDGQGGGGLVPREREQKIKLVQTG